MCIRDSTRALHISAGEKIGGADNNLPPRGTKPTDRIDKTFFPFIFVMWSYVTSFTNFSDKKI